MSLSYCLTFDYELFGSGKGCVFQHLVDPTNKILDLLYQFDVKATFFIEQLEVKAIIDRANCYLNNQRYQDEANAIYAQLARMLREGHDLQLHLHPQWCGAVYRDNSWRLNFDYWRFSSLPERNECNGQPSKLDLLIQGKAYLEELLKGYSSNYECIGFRAGGYNLGFGESTYRALKDAGIVYDSSLCPGYVTNSQFSAFDYSNVSSAKPFQLPNGLVEYPLVTSSSSIFSKLSIARLYSNFKNRKHKMLSGGRGLTSNEPPILGKASANSNFDVCLSSSLQVKNFFSITINRNHYTTVLIGHPKDYSLFSPLEKIIRKSHDYGVKFKTMTEIYRTENVHK
ncbi:hypothetical protein [Vibrio sinaloensis]|uniref:NodB homology domain-containing protein n=1 Tax=Photobacterium sp. (strain ATCC 43367) TaxID=379097 RepID=A0A0A5I2S0_PHOS4|nr:hypothetical protein [Vibrio sinaloensis]KGY10116.1 hypothetical protein NM06_04145 [Vibrio sinaloensis]